MRHINRQKSTLYFNDSKIKKFQTKDLKIQFIYKGNKKSCQ